MQTVAVEEVYVIDDGSTDDSVRLCEAEGIRVIKMGHNKGRGAARAKAMSLIHCELVLCCDATLALSEDFLEIALRHFEEKSVVAVFGKIQQRELKNAIDRWCDMYLYKEQVEFEVVECVTLLTGGAVLRRDEVLQSGNYDKSLIYGEDRDLGLRLNSDGYKLLSDIKMKMYSQIQNNLWDTLERYWRWYAGTNERISLLSYFRNVWYSIKVMAFRDICDRDLKRAFISLLCPHYQFCKTIINNINYTSNSPIRISFWN
jgi:cellulose synthase/poly-beta-1,6-N-acetylglucosamine synthase-like glycosyltransferase